MRMGGLARDGLNPSRETKTSGANGGSRENNFSPVQSTPSRIGNHIIPG